MNDRNEAQTLITLSDFWHLIRRSKGWLLLGAFCFAILALLYSLIRPVVYTGEASFRQKNHSQSGVSGDSFTLLLSSLSKAGKGEAIATFKSHRLLEGVVSNLGLQATIREKSLWVPFSGFLGKYGERAIDNLKIEYSLLRGKHKASLEDPFYPVVASDVTYTQEIPAQLTIEFFSNEKFRVIDSQNHSSEGLVGQPFQLDDIAFTLEVNTKESLQGHIYEMSLSPLTMTIESVINNLDIDVDVDDKDLLVLTYTDRDRNRACLILNTLMATYREFLQDEQGRVSDEQISYLQKKELQAADKLKSIVQEHASKQASDITTVGYTDVSRAMEFLAGQQQSNVQKMMAIDLDLKRYEQQSLELDEAAPFLAQEPVYVKEFIQTIRELKQRSDSLELALHPAVSDTGQAKDEIVKQAKDLAKVRSYTKQAKMLLEQLKKGNEIKGCESLIADPKYLVGIWCEKLRESKSETDTDKENCKVNFLSYLSNLVHYFDVYERISQERLARQQGPATEFQGINLDTANELYVSHSKALSEIEAKILQHAHLLEQMKDPLFEITSLDAILEDATSREMSSKSGKLLLALSDDVNHSEKEKERMRKELSMQKDFIAQHVKQNMQLLTVKKDLLYSKLHSLQNVTLGLIHQQISILERQLADYYNKHINRLKQEKTLLQEQQNRLQGEMAKLPERWAAGKLVDLDMRITEKMVEEISKTMESKNIMNNLEIVASAPLDIAVPPVYPKKPHLLVFALMGGLLGFFLTGFCLVVRSVFEGVVATTSNLRLSGFTVVGGLRERKPLLTMATTSHQDLQTVRQLVALLEKRQGNSLLLVQGHGCDYSHLLASLLSKKEIKVLLLSLCFDREAPSPHLPGLLQYLEGKAQSPKRIEKEGYVEITGGGISSTSMELLGLPRFAQLVEKLKTEFDCVIAMTPGTPFDPETSLLMTHFDNIVFNIRGEKLDELEPLRNDRHAFVVTR